MNLFNLLGLTMVAVAGLVVSAELLAVPPRLMWGWGPGLSGYCGEASLQSAGLFFGNYISQEQVRYAGGNTEVLIDVNLHKAADTLGFTYDRWKVVSKVGYHRAELDSFPIWTKNHLDSGHPVIVGVYESKPLRSADPDYDHIVPIIGYDTLNLALYYNDLYCPTTRTLGLKDIKTRVACTQTAEPSQPYPYCFPATNNYGIAIMGVKGTSSCQLSLDIGDWSEPDWGEEDKLHQKPITFYPKITAKGLIPGNKYSVVRFDSVDSLPEDDFLRGSWSELIEFVSENEEEVVRGKDIQSDGTYFYRCVKLRSNYD